MTASLNDRKASITLITLLLIVTIGLVPELRGPINTGYIRFYIILCLIAYVPYVLTIHRTTMQWMSFEILFATSFLVAHYVIPLNILLGIRVDPYILTSTVSINYATWLTTVGFLSYMLASLLFCRGQKFRSAYMINSDKPYISQAKMYKLIQKVSAILFALAFASFLFLAGDDFYSGNYKGTENWGSGASYFNLLVKYAAYIWMYVTVRREVSGHRRNFARFLKGHFLMALGIVCFLFLMLSSGDRNVVLEMTLFTLSLYSFYVKPLTFSRVAFYGFLGLLTFLVVGIGRRVTSVEGGNVFVRGIEQMKSNEADENSSELIGCPRLTYRAVDKFPRQFDFLYGKSMLADIVQSIPFASRTSKSFARMTSSTYIFTYIGQGVNPTYGEGSEIIADIYISFGSYGVGILMFLLGIVSTCLSRTVGVSTKDFLQIFYLILISFSVYINRAPYFTFLQTLIHVIVLFTIIMLLCKAIDKSATSKTQKTLR